MRWIVQPPSMSETICGPCVTERLEEAPGIYSQKGVAKPDNLLNASLYHTVLGLVAVNGRQGGAHSPEPGLKRCMCQ